MVINGTTLRDPDWGDSVSDLAAVAQMHHARDGTTRRTYIKRTTFYKTRFTIGYEIFEDLRTVFENLKTNIGKTISMTDWEGQSWTGAIVNSVFTMTDIGRSGCDPENPDKEYYRMTFDFEGAIS